MLKERERREKSGLKKKRGVSERSGADVRKKREEEMREVAAGMYLLDLLLFLFSIL